MCFRSGLGQRHATSGLNSPGGVEVVGTGTPGRAAGVCRRPIDRAPSSHYTQLTSGKGSGQETPQETIAKTSHVICLEYEQITLAIRKPCNNSGGSADLLGDSDLHPLATLGSSRLYYTEQTLFHNGDSSMIRQNLNDKIKRFKTYLIVYHSSLNSRFR
jgi:hypothetical protein